MRGVITACINHWVQDCATWNKSSTAGCHWTPWAAAKCLLALVTSPSSCESRNGAVLHPQIFSLSVPPQACSALLPRTLTPCKTLQAPGQAVGRAGCLSAGQNIPSADTGLAPGGFGTQWMPTVLLSLSCSTLNRIGNWQMKTKGN